jgi:hypothetical protein
MEGSFALLYMELGTTVVGSKNLVSEMMKNDLRIC